MSQTSPSPRSHNVKEGRRGVYSDLQDSVTTVVTIKVVLAFMALVSNCYFFKKGYNNFFTEKILTVFVNLKRYGI